MGSRRQLTAFNKQLRLLPPGLVEREPGLIELGRQYARAVDSGHMPSGSGVQRVLAELRKLAGHQELPVEPGSESGGRLHDLAARFRRAGIADASDRDRPEMGDDRCG